jgi:hypothetical protein
MAAAANTYWIIPTSSAPRPGTCGPSYRRRPFLVSGVGESEYLHSRTDQPNISGCLDMEDMATCEEQEQDEELQPSLASVY